MGDQSELRTLVVVGVFVGTMLTLMVLIPSELTTGLTDMSNIQNIDAPEYWETGEIMAYADTWDNVSDNDNGIWRVFVAGFGDLPPDWTGGNIGANMTLIDDGTDSDFGGHEDVYYVSRYSESGTPQGFIGIMKIARLWVLGLPIGFNWAHFYDMSGNDMGYYLTRAELNNTFTTYGNQTLKFKVQFEDIDDEFSCYLHYNWNRTADFYPSWAWSQDILYQLAGINFDQTVTSYNAFELMGSILFFNMPSIFVDIPAFIGALIGIMCWIPIIYVAYILILRTIGAIFGGGA